MFDIPDHVKEEAIEKIREILKSDGHLPTDEALNAAFDAAVETVKKSFGF